MRIDSQCEVDQRTLQHTSCLFILNQSDLSLLKYKSKFFKNSGVRQMVRFVLTKCCAMLEMLNQPLRAGFHQPTTKEKGDQKILSM